MPEKIVYNPTHDKTLKPKKEKTVEADEPVTEFKAKLNKYGFIHVPKKASITELLNHNEKFEVHEDVTSYNDKKFA